MRARNIKPGFYKNDRLAECSIAARLLAPGLWMMADKAGRIEDRPKRIKAEIFPYDDVDVNHLLNELQSCGHILRYEVAGEKYIQVLKFTEHQTPHIKEKTSEIPEPCVQAPDKHQTSTSLAQGKNPLNPESPFLNPDSGYLNPESMKPGAVAPRSRDPSPEFLVFWNLYPKTNCSRKEALQAYTKALTREKDHETIIRGVEAYNRFLAATGSPAAHATTWLNGDRWTVDYVAATSARAKPGKQTWTSAAEQIIAEDRVARAGGGGPIHGGAKSGLRSAEAIREDPGRAEGAA